LEFDKLIRQINKHKNEFDIEIYLVGGSVRDLCLELNPTDLDFVFIDNKNNIEKFIEVTFCPSDLEKSLFNTYKFNYNNYSLDFAMCRNEIYEQPASLPVVKKGNLIDDYKRRDFTVNSMYINLDTFSINNIIDHSSGLEDLKKKEIKNLHEKSFEDDPTRIFRAIRYSERLKFEIESQTLNQIHKYSSNIKNLTGTRVKNEIYKILNENNVHEILITCNELEIFNQLDLNLNFPIQKPNWGERKYTNFNHLINEQESTHFKFIVFVSTFLNHIETSQIIKLSNYFGLEKKLQKSWENIAISYNQLMKFDFNNGTNSELSKIIKNIDIESCIAFTQYLTNSQTERVYEYWDKNRNLKPQISVKEILQLGIKEGPELGKLIMALQDAVIDGKLTSKIEELDFIRNFTNQD
tara:strand:+ start:8059 stop:9285 length:1227 start_codon:yes stop_codon:yes gene_type:complete